MKTPATHRPEGPATPRNGQSFSKQPVASAYGLQDITAYYDGDADDAAAAVEEKKLIKEVDNYNDDNNIFWVSAGGHG